MSERPLDIAALRHDYASTGLDEADVAAEPLTQFAAWLGAAVEAGIPEPNAMVLATVGVDGIPSARTVLLKGVDERGFAFFTNRRSRKGVELEQRPMAALVFPWIVIGRQVTVRGRVTPLDAAASDVYFATRPRRSQLAAWASEQSQPLDSRATLQRRLRQITERFGDGVVERPGHWGGYLVEPVEVEFWQGRPDRLHDRLQYTRAEDGWSLRRLWP